MSPEDSLKGRAGRNSSTAACSLTLRGKTGWREVEIGRGSSELTCPVAALETWLKFARVARGPLFPALLGREFGSEKLNDRDVARLVKRLAVAAGVRGDLSERDRRRSFPGIRCAPARLISRDRGALCAKAPRPRFGGNHPPLPATPRPLPGQHHQGRAPLSRNRPPLPGSLPYWV